MKKIIKLFTVLLSTVLLFSCSNGFNQPEVNQNDEMAQIILNLEPVARTAYAPVTAADLSDIKLDYKKAGSSDAYENLVTYANTAAFSTADPVYLFAGTYDFKISANASGFVYKAEKTGVTLVSGKNTIDVKLVLAGMETPVGTGSFTLTLTVPSQALSKYATFSVMKEDSVLADYNTVPCTLTDEADNKVKIVAKSVEGKALAGGMYNVVIRVYADENRIFEVANLEDSIQIVNGLNTAKEYIKEKLYIDETKVQFGSFGEDRPNSYVFYNKIMSISGTGDLALSEDQRNRVEQEEASFDDLEEVFIGDRIRLITESAFYKTNLKKVSGGKGVEVIGDLAFKECQLLEELPAFDKVTYLGKEAFYNCKALKELPAFEEVENIGKNAFEGCCTLKKIDGFNKATSIGSDAFRNCTDIEEIIGFNAFTGNALPSGLRTSTSESKIKYVKGFNSLTSIPLTAFSDNEVLETVEGFNSIESIEALAFYNCKSLKNFNFKGSLLKTIGYSAFEECPSLTEIVIPASVTKISYQTFFGNNATSIYILGTDFSFDEKGMLHFYALNHYFSGDFYFVGSEAEWKKILGLDESATDEDYQNALSNYGFATGVKDKNIKYKPHFNYIVPASN